MTKNVKRSLVEMNKFEKIINEYLHKMKVLPEDFIIKFEPIYKKKRGRKSNKYKEFLEYYKNKINEIF